MEVKEYDKIILSWLPEELEKELKEREERTEILIDKINYYNELLEIEYWKIEEICEKISELKCKF